MTGAELVDAIYGRFVLRDFFGKMIPGLISIISAAWALVPPNILGPAIEKLPGFAWLALAGFSWLTGFALQSLGEWVRLIKYIPPEEKETWVEKYLRFRSTANASSVREHERMVVIMEACGNGSVACLSSIMILIADALINALSAPSFGFFVASVSSSLFAEALSLILLLVMGVSLERMHRVHRKRHVDLLKNFPEKIEEQNEEDAKHEPGK